jgi:hypothetical protein
MCYPSGVATPRTSLVGMADDMLHLIRTSLTVQELSAPYGFDGRVHPHSGPQA